MLGPRLVGSEALIETIEAALPESTVLLEPVDRLLERRRLEARGPKLGRATAGDEAGALEHPEVLRDGLERDRERLGQLVHRGLALGETTEDRSAGGVGEGREGDAELVGRHLVSLHPRDITVEWSIPKRTGKIFMDYNMNVRGKTLNVAYSPRGEPGAPVSMPLTWEELERAHPLDFRLTNAAERLARTGDRWHEAYDKKQDIERALKRVR